MLRTEGRLALNSQSLALPRGNGAALSCISESPRQLWGMSRGKQSKEAGS